MKATKILHNNIHSVKPYPTGLGIVSAGETSGGLVKDGRDFVADASINSREMQKLARGRRRIFTATGVDSEASSKWGNAVDNGDILQSASVGEVRGNAESTSLTAPIGSSGRLESSVDFEPSDGAVCASCGAPVRGILRSSHGTAYVCQRLSDPDQRLLVVAVAFPEYLALITDEGCLGWSSAPLGSYSLGKWKYWCYHFWELNESSKSRRKN